MTRRICGLGIVGLAAILTLLTGCGGDGAPDRQQVEREVRQFEHRNGEVVHRVSCEPLGGRWSCRVHVDDPNGSGHVVAHTCEARGDANMLPELSCGGQ